MTTSECTCWHQFQPDGKHAPDCMTNVEHVHFEDLWHQATAERDEARAEVARLRAVVTSGARDAYAEVERLRAALQSITEIGSAPLMWQIAAAALEAHKAR